MKVESETAEEVKAYEQFADSFEKKLEAAESDDADDAEHEESDGSAPADDDAEDDTEGAGDDDEDAGADDDEGEGSGDPQDEDDENGDEQDDASESGEEENGAEDDDEQGDDTAADDESDDEAAAAEVQAALKEAGLKLSIKDLPKEAQPIVRRKLDEMQAAFTRLRQQDTVDRKKLREVRAEMEFFQKSPALAIVELLKKNPKVSDEVNALIDKLSDEDKARLVDSDVKDARKKVTDALDAEEKASKELDERGDQIEAYVRRAAAKLGVPIEEAEEAIAFRIMQKPVSEREITEAEIDQVLTRKARIFKGVDRRTKLGQRQQEIRERTKSRKTSTPAVRAGAGITAPRPVGKKVAKTDEEFSAQFIAKMK